MATDATGTPTSLGIPKYNPDADAPSGLGFNAAMDSINTLIGSRMNSPASPVTGDVPVWDSGTSTWKPSSVKKAGVSALDASGQPDGNAIVASSGNAVWGAAGPLTYKPAPVTIVNSVVQTTLASQAIPGGTLGSTKKLRVALEGDLTNNKGSGGTVRFQITWGGTLIVDFTSGSIASGTTNRGPWKFDFDLYASADTGHQALTGRAVIASPGLLTAGIGGGGDVGSTVGALPVAVDSTVSQTLLVQATLSAAHALFDIRMLHAMIEVVG